MFALLMGFGYAQAVGELEVIFGGTGAGTFTSNSILKGNTTGALQASGVLIDSSNNITPATSDTAQLGTSSLMWSDLFLASGGVINLNNGDVTITHSSNTLSFAGATSGYRFDAAVIPAGNDGSALGAVTSGEWSDLFLAQTGVINWDGGDVTLTQSDDLLALGGGGFTVSGNVTGSNNAIFTNKVWANAGSEIVSNEASYIVSTDADTGEYTDIQTAMNVACVTAGAVFIKAGTYTLTSTLAVGCSDLTIYGEGESTIIQFNGSSVTNAFANSGTTQRSRLRIGNMKIISTSSGNGTGIEMNYWRKSLFEKLHIVDVNVCVHGGGSGVFYNTVQNVQCEPEGTGNIGFKFDLEGNDNRLIDTQVISASGLTTTGYYIDAAGIWITGADVDSAAIGIDIQDGGTNSTVMNSWLEANDVAIDIDTAVETTSIIGNRLSSSVTTDISGGGRGIFVQTHSNGDPLFFYGNSSNDRFGIGTSAPAYALDIQDTSLATLMRINGGGSGYVQSAIRLDSDNTTRGNGIYTYDATSLEEWYFGNPYSGNDAFVINRRANAASFNLDAADEADADVQNFFNIDSAGLVTLTSLSSSADVTVGDDAFFNTGLYPDINDGATLGSTLLSFSDIFLAEGGVINWDAGDATLTQANNVLTLAGADFVADTVTTNTGLMPDANDGAYLGQSGTAFSDLFLANGAVINFNAGNTTLTHSAGLLTLAGAMATSSGVTVGGAAIFDTAIYPDVNDGATIGGAGLNWSDLFLASGSVINWNESDLTLTHSANTLTLAGGSLDVSAGTLTVGTFAGTIDAGGATSFEIPNGTGPTVNAAGEIAIDTTDNQLVHYGTAETVISGELDFAFAIATPANGAVFNLFKARNPLTISAWHCIVVNGTNTVVRILEADSTGASGATIDADVTCDTNGAADDGSLSNGTIDAGDWVQVQVVSVSGGVSSVTGDAYYTLDRQ